MKTRCIASHDKGKILEFWMGIKSRDKYKWCWQRNKWLNEQKNGPLASSPVLPSCSSLPLSSPPSSPSHSLSSPSPPLPVKFQPVADSVLPAGQGNSISPPPLPPSKHLLPGAAFLLGTAADFAPPTTCGSPYNPGSKGHLSLGPRSLHVEGASYACTAPTLRQ